MKHSTQGLTLVEIIVAVLIIAGALMVVLQAFTANAATNSRSDNRTEAATAITSVLDQLRAVDVTTLPSTGNVDKVVTIGRHDYTVRLAYCTIPSYCATDSRMIRASALSGTTEVNWVETIFTNINGVSVTAP